MTFDRGPVVRAYGLRRPVLVAYRMKGPLLSRAGRRGRSCRVPDEMGRSCRVPVHGLPTESSSGACVLHQRLGQLECLSRGEDHAPGRKGVAEEVYPRVAVFELAKEVIVGDRTRAQDHGVELTELPVP